MRWIRIALIFLLVFTALVLIFKFVLPFFKGTNSFLKVATKDMEVNVLLDNKLVGKTPYLGERLAVGNHKLTLEAEISQGVKKKVSFSTPITLTSQALTAVNYEFGPNLKFSSGDIRTFRPGSGLSIISSPTNASLWLDGEPIGRTPVSATATAGVHKLKVSLDGYVTRELEINIEPTFRLVVEVFLSANPFTDLKKLEEGDLTLYDLSTKNDALYTEPVLWSEGVFFLEKNVGVEFDALIDRDGKTYFKDKNAWAVKIKGGKALVAGYLGNAAEPNLTEKAKNALMSLREQAKPPPAAAPQVEILTTPIGTLNVRAGPGQNYPVIAKVAPGEKYALLEEGSGWYKIKLSKAEGWISSQYAKKL